MNNLISRSMLLFSLFFVSIVFASCEQKEEDSLLIYYSKTKCFGNCEVYNLTISKSGEVKYEGIKNVEYLGKFVAIISEEEINSIRNLVIDSDFIQLSNKYIDKNVRDLPRIILQYETKKIEFHKRNAPKNLIELSHSIEQILAQISLKKP